MDGVEKYFGGDDDDDDDDANGNGDNWLRKGEFVCR